MNITVSIPNDEQRLRSLVGFHRRRSVINFCLVGAVSLVLGGVMVLAGVMPTTTGIVAILMIVLGLVVLGPVLAARVVRAQAVSVREGYELTLDDTGCAVTSESSDSRFVWSLLQGAAQRPEAWYLNFGTLPATAVFKDVMTGQQQAEFADFLAQRQSV